MRPSRPPPSHPSTRAQLCSQCYRLDVEAGEKPEALRYPYLAKLLKAWAGVNPQLKRLREEEPAASSAPVGGPRSVDISLLLETEQLLPISERRVTPRLARVDLAGTEGKIAAAAGRKGQAFGQRDAAGGGGGGGDGGVDGDGAGFLFQFMRRRQTAAAAQAVSERAARSQRAAEAWTARRTEDRIDYVGNLEHVEQQAVEAAERDKEAMQEALVQGAQRHSCFAAGLCEPAPARSALAGHSVLFVLLTCMFKLVLPALFCSACDKDILPSSQAVGFTPSAPLGGGAWFSNRLLSALDNNILLSGQSTKGVLPRFFPLNIAYWRCRFS